jgi:hypothetical protein
MAKIKCSRCGGRGEIELTGVYAVTLKALRKRGEVTGTALAKEMNANPTAVLNRLAALERFGLARSRQFGRERHYEAVKQ